MVQNPDLEKRVSQIEAAYRAALNQIDRQMREIDKLNERLDRQMRKTYSPDDLLEKIKIADWRIK